MVDQSRSRKQHKHSVEMCCARWFLHQPLMSKLFSASVTQRLVHRKKWILTPRKTGFEKISKKKSNKLNPTERKNSIRLSFIQYKARYGSFVSRPKGGFCIVELIEFNCHGVMLLIFQNARMLDLRLIYRGGEGVC